MSPDAPNVDVYARVGHQEVLLFRHLAYRSSTEYLEVDSGCYDILVRVAGTRNTVLELEHVCVESRNVYSVFVNGLVETVFQEEVSMQQSLKMEITKISTVYYCK